MTKIIKIFFLFFIFLSFTFCGTTSTDNLLGGTEIGNPPISTQRYIVGSFSDEVSEPTLIKYTETIDCPADLVRATSTESITFEAEMTIDCSFILTVDIDTIYFLQFLLGEEVVATLEVDNNSLVLLSPNFIVSASDGPMDLGTITIEGTFAYPQNQPATENDQDGDGINDFDDDDDDGDGVADDDSDGDSFEDDVDNCVSDPNPDQTDTDEDGEGDACDTDDDGDGHGDTADNCPNDINSDQSDTDQDGIGDVCDDSDSDGVFDDTDNCLNTVNTDQTDTDGDGEGDACDTDDDGDGILDDGDGSGAVGDNTCMAGAYTNCDDNCRLTINPYQIDYNYNGVGDACEVEED